MLGVAHADTIEGRVVDITDGDTITLLDVDMAHPIHVHGVRMSPLARDGALPPAYERGLRDTFIVESMQTVTVAVETPAQASPMPLMFHCHILEHEEAGMMGQFITV